MLSHALQRHFQEEATVLLVQAGFFLNQAQFLDAVPEQIPVGAFSLGVADIVTALAFHAELGLAPKDFTIQLLGSRSEQGVIDFLEGAELPFANGFFETRYQGGRWFVAVTSGLSSREVANASLASLSPAILELQPWVRPVSQLPSLIKRLRKPTLPPALVSDDRSCIIAFLCIYFGSTPHERSLFACLTEAACGSHSGMDDATGRQIFA